MVIVVASGKGGTGKTTVATNLALSLASHQRVQFLDLDVEEPNAHIFLKPQDLHQEKVNKKVPRVDYDKCTFCGLCADVCAFNALVVLHGEVLFFSELCHSCGACSYFCPADAIREDDREIGVIESAELDNISFHQGKLDIGEVAAPAVISVLKQRLKRDGTVIMDAPPGTSCSVIESVKGVDFCVLVTEPTPFGLSDLKLMVELLKQLQIPAGIIVNRYQEGRTEVEDYARVEGIQVMARIPFDRKIATCYSEGRPFIKVLPGYAGTFAGLLPRIEGLVGA